MRRAYETTWFDHFIMGVMLAIGLAIAATMAAVTL